MIKKNEGERMKKLRPQVLNQMPRLLRMVADTRRWGKELVLRSLKNNTRRKEVSIGSMSRKDRFQAQQIIRGDRSL